MDLTPLTHAPLPIRVHAFAALGAFVLGAMQLAGVKGTTQHRALGYTWAALMLIVAVSSFWVHEIRPGAPGARSISCRSSRSQCSRSASGKRTTIALSAIARR
jgi:uncharacterized membrane protein